MKAKLFLIAALAATLAACNGGGTSLSSGSGSTTALSVFVTDDISTEYSKVWVTVLEVAAVDASSQEHVLYQDPAGKVFNLSELSAVGALLRTAELSAGNYTALKLTLADEVKLVNKNGLSVTAHFNNTGTPQAINIPASFTVTQGQSGAVALDFDLKQFTYNATTGLITPVIVFKAETEVQKLDRRYAKVEGVVTAISDAAHFTIDIASSSPAITVELSANSVVIDETTRTVSTDTAALAVNDRVDVYGNYDAATLTLAAVRVKIEDALSTGSLSARHEAEGRVVSFDGSTLVLDVREANFVPGADTVTVNNITNAVFTKGSLVLLQAGQNIEVKGSWDGSLLTAKIVEIEGAAPAHSTASDSGSYAEVKGRITARNGDILTLQIMKVEHVNLNLNDNLSVNIGDAWLKTGSDACLATGAYVEVKGALSGDIFKARVVDIESGCGGSASLDNTDDPSHAEAKGVVSAVNGTLVTLQVVQAEGFLPGGNSISVETDGAWFDHGSRDQLVVNALVEINGSWSSSLFTANKVEFKW